MTAGGSSDPVRRKKITEVRERARLGAGKKMQKRGGCGPWNGGDGGCR